ncbi:MAG: NADH:flavin oxidoreductase [Spirochaetes bacterium]|nr:MAG: NADH:flavin oxidoreductase [Spirochaetota bacterium]
MSFSKLFEPIQIGSMEVKNRIAMAPMNMGYTDPLGYPGDQVLAHYAMRARGGFGLLITEAVIINPHAWYGGDAMNVSQLTDYRFYRFWSKVVETVHTYDKCKICIQLSPGWGRQGHPPVTSPHVYPAAPSAIPLHIDLRNLMSNKGWETQLKKRIDTSFAGGIDFTELIKMPDEMYFSDDVQLNLKKMVMGVSEELYHIIWREAPREITVEEIVEMEDRMAAQAEAAFQLGFDAVELHSPHGYLIHQFLSPMMNKRVDDYGGSVENRARILTNMIKKIRKRVGNDKPVLCRLSGADLQPGGATHEEMCQIAALCKDAGVNAINISQGSYQTSGSTFAYNGEGDFSKWAKGFKEATGLPTIAPNFVTPHAALKAITEDSVDIISLGRQSIADPFWPVKVKENRVKDIVKCTRCQQCYAHFIFNKWLHCAVNPTAGRERFFPDLWMKGSKLESRIAKFKEKAEDLPQI